MKFKTKWEINPDENLIILTGKNDIADNDYTNDKEKEYLESMAAKDKKMVSINQYNRRLIFVIGNTKGKKWEKHEKLRKAGSSVYDLLKRLDIKNISIINKLKTEEERLAFTEGLALSAYKFDKYISDKKRKKYSLKTVSLEQASSNEIKYLESIVFPVFFARDLVNEPVSYLDSPTLARELKKMAKKAGLKVKVLDKKAIEKEGMGGILAVNQASPVPPTFTILEWKPEEFSNKKPIVLVGKGLVYDTGGLSLKPTQNSMDEMKCDMAGAATVAGAIFAAAKAELPLHIITLIPSTDNRPGGNAYAPGDIITMHDGSTVEVLNTDAEGRLILADALSYAKRYKPELVIDAATLTGAAAMILGHHGIVNMGNAPDKVFAKMEKSGLNTYERLVRMPFWDEFGEMMKSDIADQKNLGGRIAGAITAGKFLEKFTDAPYIHLDIAGPAFITSKESYLGKGGTGYGIRMLLDFLKNY